MIVSEEKIESGATLDESARIQPDPRSRWAPPMRACMVAYTFYDSDNRVRRYAETLARQGYQVDVVALRNPGCYEGITTINGVLFM